MDGRPKQQIPRTHAAAAPHDPVGTGKFMANESQCFHLSYYYNSSELIMKANYFESSSNCVSTVFSLPLSTFGSSIAWAAGDEISVVDWDIEASFSFRYKFKYAKTPIIATISPNANTTIVTQSSTKQSPPLSSHQYMLSYILNVNAFVCEKRKDSIY